MILGICALTLGWLYGLGIVAAIVGLILGIVGKRKASEVGAPTGMATAGIVMSVIGLVSAILIVVACIACLGVIGSDEFWYYY